MAQKFSRTIVREHILLLLNKHDILHYGDFHEKIKCHKQTLTDALKELEETQQIEKIKRGTYTLPTTKKIAKFYPIFLKDLNKLEKQYRKNLKKKDGELHAYFHIMHLLSLLSASIWDDVVGHFWKKSGDFSKSGQFQQRIFDDIVEIFAFLHDNKPNFAHKISPYIRHKIRESFDKSMIFPNKTEQ